jgi:predicted branched-subunit amino acid permease
VNKLFLKGVKHGLPIGLGYLSVSFAFGMQCVGGGLTVMQALLISMTNLTSAGQLAGLQVMLAGSSLVEMALTQFIINLRYSLMGISLSQRLDGSFTTPWRMLLSFHITDEIFAVASTKRHKVGTRYFAGLASAPYLGWALGTLLGALAGTLLPDTVRGCLGLMLFGMFIAIIIPPARRERGVLFAICVAVGLSCLFYYLPFFDFLSGGFSLIISAVIASVLAAWLFPVANAHEEVDA